MGDLLGRCRIQMHVSEQVGICFSEQESCECGDLSIAESIVGHRCRRIVHAWIAYPGLEPLGLHLAADARKFGAYVTAYDVSRGILHGMARRAEGFSVQAGSGSRIARRLRRERNVVSRNRCAVRRILL